MIFLFKTKVYFGIFFILTPLVLGLELGQEINLIKSFDELRYSESDLSNIQENDFDKRVNDLFAELELLQLEEETTTTTTTTTSTTTTTTTNEPEFSDDKLQTLTYKSVEEIGNYKKKFKREFYQS